MGVGTVVTEVYSCVGSCRRASDVASRSGTDRTRRVVCCVLILQHLGNVSLAIARMSESSSRMCVRAFDTSHQLFRPEFRHHHSCEAFTLATFLPRRTNATLMGYDASAGQDSPECDLNQIYYDQIKIWSVVALCIAVVGLGLGLKGWGCGRKVQRNCMRPKIVCAYVWSGGVLGVIAILMPLIGQGFAVEAAVDERCRTCAAADCSVKGREGVKGLMQSFGTLSSVSQPETTSHLYLDHPSPTSQTPRSPQATSLPPLYIRPPAWLIAYTYGMGWLPALAGGLALGLAGSTCCNQVTHREREGFRMIESLNRA